MAFSFEPFLAISAGHIMAVSAGPEQHQPARDSAAVIHIRDTEVEILPGIDVNTTWIRGELYSMHQFFTQYLQKLKNMVQ